MAEKCCASPNMRLACLTGDGKRQDVCDNCGKESDFYEAELGQMAFGNPSGELDFDNMPESHVVEHMLRTLAYYATGDSSYAGDYTNDVFKMHGYYWGDCTCGFENAEYQWDKTHSHSPECYQTEYQQIPRGEDWPKSNGAHDRAVQSLCRKHGIPWDNGQGSAVHCTCTYRADWRAWREAHDHAAHCPTVLPNFRHKASGLEIRWYKYIGRGMSVSKHVCPKCFRNIFAECMNSLEASA